MTLSEDICKMCGVEPKLICFYTDSPCTTEYIDEKVVSGCPMTIGLKDCVNLRTNNIDSQDIKIKESFVQAIKNVDWSY